MRSIERKQANVSAASNDQVLGAFVCRSLLRFPGCVQDFRPPIGVSVPATPCIPSGRTRPSEHGLPRPAFFGKELRAVKTPRHDRVAAPRFHLIGESFGGTVTLYTSVVQGARLLSATCISAPHRGGSIKVLKGWNTLLGTADGMRAWSQNMMEYRFRDGAVSPAAFAWFKAEQDKTDPAMVRGVSELVMKTDLTPFLVRVLGPVLLLAPDSSPFVESQLVAELHGLLTTSELQVFAGTRHGLAFSHARECAELFVEFTIRNGRRPAGAQ